QVDRVVRTGLDARLAADAGVAVEIDDAVRPLVQGHHRADRHARRLRAVVAAQHGEMAAHGRERADLGVLDPGAEGADAHVVLRLARHRAGVAADALAVVEDEAVLHGRARDDSCAADTDKAPRAARAQKARGLPRAGAGGRLRRKAVAYPTRS